MERDETDRDAREAGKAAGIGGAEPRPAGTLTRLAFGAQVLDCVLLDVSRGGARVRLLSPAEVPETATLRFRDGEGRSVQRRWQRGAEVGFKVVGPA